MLFAKMYFSLSVKDSRVRDRVAAVPEREDVDDEEQGPTLGRDPHLGGRPRSLSRLDGPDGAEKPPRQIGGGNPHVYIYLVHTSMRSCPKN